MNFFVKSAAEPVLCFPDGIEGERHEANDTDIVHRKAERHKKLKVIRGSNHDSDLHLHVLFISRQLQNNAFFCRITITNVGPLF